MIKEINSQKTFFVNEVHDLRMYQGNALELLRQEKSETFDLIFADPPYFLSNNGVTCQSGKWLA